MPKSRLPIEERQHRAWEILPRSTRRRRDSALGRAEFRGTERRSDPATANLLKAISSSLGPVGQHSLRRRQRPANSVRIRTSKIASLGGGALDRQRSKCEMRTPVGLKRHHASSVRADGGSRGAGLLTYRVATESVRSRSMGSSAVLGLPRYDNAPSTRVRAITQRGDTRSLVNGQFDGVGSGCWRP